MGTAADSRGCSTADCIARCAPAKDKNHEGGSRGRAGAEALETLRQGASCHVRSLPPGTRLRIFAKPELLFTYVRALWRFRDSYLLTARGVSGGGSRKNLQDIFAFSARRMRRLCIADNRGCPPEKRAPASTIWFEASKAGAEMMDILYYYTAPVPMMQ